MSKPRSRKKGNPDLRRKTNQPGVEISEITKKIFELLEPKMFTSLKYLQGNHEKIMRDRLLSLPVMVALMVSIVYRQIASLSEAVRVLKEEGLLWIELLKVTKQAVSKRIMNVPAEIFAILLKGVLEKAAEKAEKIQVEEKWEKVREKFSAVWIADGSTLEQIRKNMKISQEEKSKLGGKIMMVVEAFTQRPVTLWYTENDKSNDKRWCEELAAKLPENGLMIVDMGFFSFVWFDLLAEAKKFFLTRFRAGTSYQTKQVLSQGSHYKDEIIIMGNYRSNPCKHPVRLVSVLWGTTWYQYLTNVLSPEQLSAEEVCDLYRRRWTIEEAFLLTKRLLGLAYLGLAEKG
jgi:hypothetical protein